MRLFKFCAVLVLAIGCVSVFADGRMSRYTASKSNFLGLSSDPVLGDVKLSGLEAACWATFGSKTRVCTSEEIIKAPPLRKSIPNSGAWVYPTTVDATPDLQAGGFDMMDFSLTAASSLTNFSCRVWSTQVAESGQAATGLMVSGLKMFRLGSCAEPKPVACCRAQ